MDLDIQTNFINPHLPLDTPYNEGECTFEKYSIYGIILPRVKSIL